MTDDLTPENTLKRAQDLYEKAMKDHQILLDSEENARLDDEVEDDILSAINEAADLGLIDAQLELGYLYMYGIGVDQDFEEARKRICALGEEGTYLKVTDNPDSEISLFNNKQLTAIRDSQLTALDALQEILLEEIRDEFKGDEIELGKLEKLEELNESFSSATKDENLSNHSLVKILLQVRQDIADIRQGEGVLSIGQLPRKPKPESP